MGPKDSRKGYITRHELEELTYTLLKAAHSQFTPVSLVHDILAQAFHVIDQRDIPSRPCIPFDPRTAICNTCHQPIYAEAPQLLSIKL